MDYGNLQHNQRFEYVPNSDEDTEESNKSMCSILYLPLKRIIFLDHLLSIQKSIST